MFVTTEFTTVRFYMPMRSTPATLSYANTIVEHDMLLKKKKAPPRMQRTRTTGFSIQTTSR